MQGKGRLPGDIRGECRSSKRPALSCSNRSTSGKSPENRRKRGGKAGIRDRKQVCISSEVGLGCG